jgi:hypothetical protein
MPAAAPSTLSIGDVLPYKLATETRLTRLTGNATTGSSAGSTRRNEMIDPKRYIGPVLLVCLAFFFLFSYAGATLTQPDKPTGSTVHRDLGDMPAAEPLLLPARSQITTFDRLACRLKCEQIGFWDMEQEMTQRLVTACKIGCDVGRNHCL